MRSLPLNTFALAMSRLTIEGIRKAAAPVTEPPGAMIGGIEVRVNRFMPEQMAAVLDRDGNVLAVIDMRPKPEPKNQWGRDAAYRAEYRRLAGNPDPMFGLRTAEGWSPTPIPEPTPEGR